MSGFKRKFGALLSKVMKIKNSETITLLRLSIKRGIFLSGYEDEYDGSDFEATTCREVAAVDFESYDNSIFVCNPKEISLSKFLAKAAKWIGVKASTKTCVVNNYHGVQITDKSGFWATKLGFELFSLFCRSYTLLPKVNISFSEWQKQITGKDLFDKRVVFFIRDFKTLPKHIIDTISNKITDYETGLCESIEIFFDEDINDLIQDTPTENLFKILKLL